MKHVKLVLIAAVFAAFCAAAPAQDVGALIAQIQSEDTAQRMAAVDAIVRVGAPAIAPLFGLLEGENRDADVAARTAIERIVYGASAPTAANRADVASALAQVAREPGRPGVRRHALRMVSFVGRDEVVPVLAALLREPDVREMARWALVRIPGEAAAQALADALPAASGQFKAGLINALAARRAAAALPTLQGAVHDPDESVRIAAIEALSSIPDPSSEPLLRNALASTSPRVSRAASDAYIRLAEALLAAGRTEDAAAMFWRRYRNAGSEQERCAALGGLARARGEAAVPVLLKALQAGQAALAGVATLALVDVPGESATRMIARALGRATGRTRLRLLGVLAQRRDPVALPALMAAAGPRSQPSVREAALRALGEIGSTAAVPTLVQAAAAGEEAVKAAAVAALAQLPGRTATHAVVEAAQSATGATRATLVRVLGYRHDRRGSRAVLEAMRDNGPEVRIAAIQAAGDLGDPSLAPALLDVLRTGSTEEQAAAEQALGRLRGAEARAAMVAALQGSTDAAKAAILRALGRRAQPDLFDVYAAAASDRSDAVAMAALDALARLRDERAAEVFLDAARRRSPEVGAVAAHGYLLLGSEFLERNRAQAAEMARLALRLPGDEERRRAALAAVAQLRDAGSLPLVQALLSDETMGGEAARTVAAIADGLAASDREQAIGLYRQALLHGRDGDLLRGVIRKLRALGVDVDPAADAGFVTHWWVLGPFENAGRLAKQDVIRPDAAVDVGKSVQVGGKTYEWQAVQVDDPLGGLNLDSVYGGRDDCGAYLYAEVSVDAPRDVLLKIGSDDDVVCWLNGQQVHAFFGGRGYAPDQDVVATRLRGGVNSVLLKVLDRGGDWAAGLRIVDPGGRVIGFKQRKP